MCAEIRTGIVRRPSTLRRLITTVTVLCVCAPTVAFAEQDHPGLDAPGFQKNRDYFSEMPFENIDTLSGSLVLTFTDLVLPGNAGRELKFQRTYNSKGGTWTFGVVGVPLRISRSAVPDTGHSSRSRADTRPAHE